MYQRSTSNKSQLKRGIKIENSNLDKGFFTEESLVMPCKLFTVHINNLIKNIGTIKLDKIKEIVDETKLNIEIEE